ncbi:hypothetical protein PHIM7_262 [Sinorhizobium phage phiM7]|uniref:Uncharacterized protein n=3 Tax=Emdodecavirus TaxID=1980937 RepID=S5MDE1_9CAUD|nr:hypothetical protein AB690_gp247 [Sinorhizobium phage phiM12]YP_009212507.1 hypothetical protein AVT40_gp266 [Sinorhizobium phage phiN3]YP_009601387.1 hypothetical protein FDH46_gp216 [Sinorhizobium phage phiM7]AKF13167.1 hypothetical protein PHIM19_262 [Sinorhizobium phage phiM19]AGR47979.1 hypothetical protein SmphiM12_347 [Sinorhizobium phage phiM12]AKF12807.1 hypothetical protein PHIM7_262 [Sinorhizobium phage phiM7]AKF13530.1 hypothetical protein PHIN3_267 [Sinorhizobium phage phiN3]
MDENIVVRRWFFAYSKYLQLNEPDITEEEICFRFAEVSNSFMKMYEENPERWSGNIAVMLVHYTDMYERLSENLIYRGATTSSEKTRWSL